MKIARVEWDGTVDYAVQSDDGTGWTPLGPLGIRPVTSADLVGSLASIRDAIQKGTPLPSVRPVRFLCPVIAPSKSLAVGRNYALHAREGGHEPPVAPIFFTKWVSSYAGPNDDVVVNRGVAGDIDYEVELVVLIGRRARDVHAGDWRDFVAGYLVGNDVSARDVQRRDGQFGFAKGMDTFGPLGPWVTTADDVPDPHALRLQTHVNGESRQDSRTSELLFDIPFLLEYLTRVVTLEAGDVIWTGTPHGVAGGAPDLPFLEDGDVVHCEVEGLGALENRIRDRH